jgi:hypothetical protein
MELRDFLRDSGVGFAVEPISPPPDTPPLLLDQQHYQIIIWRYGAWTEVHTTFGFGGVSGEIDPNLAFMSIRAFVGLIHRADWGRMAFLLPDSKKKALLLASQVEALMGDWWETFLGEITYDRSKQ